MATSSTNTPTWGATSLTCAVVYFHDGNSRKFHSRDGSDRFTPADPRALGLGRLRRMIEKWGPAVQRGLIYDTASQQEIARYERGCWV